MITIGIKEEKITEKNKSLNLKSTSLLLADFFNGFVIEFEEEYYYEK